MNKKGKVKKLTVIAVVTTLLLGGGLLAYEEYYNHKYRGGVRPSTTIDPKAMAKLRNKDRNKDNQEIDTSKYNIELYSTNKSYLGNPDTRNDVWIETLNEIEEGLFNKGLGLVDETKKKIQKGYLLDIQLSKVIQSVKN